MSDILQDIDEALKRDKAEKFWKENGPILVTGAIALVIFTGAFATWNNWKLNQDTKQTSLLISAFDTPYLETALEAAAGSLKGKHKAIALMQDAGIKARAKKMTEAITLYKQVADDMAAPSTLRDLATLSAVKLSWENSTNAEQAKILLNDLKPLLGSKNPWSKQAAVQAALMHGEGLQDYKAAVKYLAPVVESETTPPSLKDRAKAMLHLYEMKDMSNAKQPDTAEQKG